MEPDRSTSLKDWGAEPGGVGGVKGGLGHWLSGILGSRLWGLDWVDACKHWTLRCQDEGRSRFCRWSMLALGGVL